MFKSIFIKRVFPVIVLVFACVAIVVFFCHENCQKNGIKQDSDDEIVCESADSLVLIERRHPGVTIYIPKFASMDLVCGVTSPEDDTKAIFCCAASFTGQILDEFRHSNIAGNHVSGGVYYKGYRCRPNTGAFVWYGGKWKFLLDDYEAELKLAADFGGLGFAQNIIVHAGKVQPLFRSNTFQYRALCELEGRICIIQSDAPMPYRNYVDMLNALGVRHAIYLDMGGWNHSWYRVQAQEDVTYIRKNPHSATPIGLRSICEMSVNLTSVR